MKKELFGIKFNDLPVMHLFEFQTENNKNATDTAFAIKANHECYVVLENYVGLISELGILYIEDFRYEKLTVWVDHGRLAYDVPELAEILPGS